jgi:nitrite reductase (cytochrome c-552)
MNVSARLMVAVGVLSAVATIAIAYLLTTIFAHKQDAKRAFNRVVEVTEISTDPRPWGLNWPHQFDQYKQTAGDKFYGGSSALPESKLEQLPWLKRLYAGYAFSIDYREARGHAYMLYDQVVTERVNQRQQAGACLHCHGSTTVLYRKAGLEAMGLPSDDAALAEDFNMPAVIKGFEVLSTQPYHTVLELLTQMPDGSRPGDEVVFPSAPVGGFDPEKIPEGHFELDRAHPVSCIDCHDPKTMAIRITRPGFVRGIAVLAASDDPLPHLPSIEKWRRGGRDAPYDPNLLATRQEMRSFTCGQCHVEYYCAPRDTLEFPWAGGLKMEAMERHWEEKTFPDGSPFLDFVHAETGAPLFKVQHPEFELWNQGVHARAGVSCADCHMPYERVGAMKLSNHNVRSPMENINNACQVCHNVPEDDLRSRVLTIQDRTVKLTEVAAVAMTDMLDAILEAQAAGATDEDLAEALEMQRKSMWRLDFISSENSKGFHADQESARILAESIDYSRQAQAVALRWRAPAAGEAPAADDSPE